ncbi:MAG: sodium:dicarboxylate symporter [Planctomycetaceae bacterium]|nr:sodium:dicarboxylate symporter [Planctomycetaceae bacterium]
MVKKIALPAGPLIFILVTALTSVGGLDLPQALLAGLTTWCAIWWVTEPVPVAATSLIPLAALPLFGVMGRVPVAQAYGDKLILLLMCGFMLSRAMECTGAHRKVAIGVVNGVSRIFGKGPRSVIFAFMIATAALSMWISNTATTLMMLPVALAVIGGASDRRVAIPLLLGIAYAANIGGIGTPIGTPPNVIFMGVFDGLGHRAADFGFLEWMMIGIPVVLVFVPIAWWWLVRGVKGEMTFDLPEGQGWTRGQVGVLIVFTIAALLWIFQKYPVLPSEWATEMGLERLGGWSGLIVYLTNGAIDATMSGPATVAAVIAVALFAIPDGDGGRLLDWPHARTIPWGVLLLFGGGIALARAFGSTGLGDVVAGQLEGFLGGASLITMIIVTCLFMTFLTEVTSNTALTALMMPILGATALAIDVDPVLLMAPAAMSASCAFMLPVATAPNAAVYGTEEIPINRMVREGFVLNLIGVAIISIVSMLLISTASESDDVPSPIESGTSASVIDG